ncbi:hypothetical protein [Enterococcus sp. DIV0421]
MLLPLIPTTSYGYHQTTSTKSPTNYKTANTGITDASLANFSAN